MAAQEKPGRNDRCSCGSGKKYKNCCAKKASSRMSPASWAAILAAVAAAGVLLVLLFNVARGGAGGPRPGSGICPPGQVWDPIHNHCH
jgi:hypothetical protein